MFDAAGFFLFKVVPDKYYAGDLNAQYICYGIGIICLDICNLIEVISIFVVVNMKLPPSKKQAAHTEAVKEFLRCSIMVTKRKLLIND